MKTVFSMSETDTQNSILQYLKFKKITAWRNNNGSVYDPKNKRFRSKNKWEKVHGDPVDILGILPDGRFLAIEVKKDEKGKASEGQQKFLDTINEQGGVAFVAWSIECVSTRLNLS